MICHSGCDILYSIFLGGGSFITINVKRDFELFTLEITGRLDTTTAPNLETVVNELSEGTKELVFDISGVEYISSVGVKVLIW